MERDIGFWWKSNRCSNNNKGWNKIRDSSTLNQPLVVEHGNSRENKRVFTQGER